MIWEQPSSTRSGRSRSRSRSSSSSSSSRSRSSRVVVVVVVVVVIVAIVAAPPEYGACLLMKVYSKILRSGMSGKSGHVHLRQIRPLIYLQIRGPK